MGGNQLGKIVVKEEGDKECWGEESEGRALEDPVVREHTGSRNWRIVGRKDQEMRQVTSV